MNRFREIRALVASLAILLAGLSCAPAPIAEEHHEEGLSNEVVLTASAQQVAGIATAVVEESRITRAIETTGVVTPAQDRVAHVRPLARGIITDIDVQLGDRVVAGSELLEYDNIELGDLTGEYAEIVAGIARLDARRNVAEQLRGRAEALLEVEAISRSEFDLRQTELDQAVADLAAGHAGLLRVEEKLHRFGMTDEQLATLRDGHTEAHRTASHDRLVAPFDGVVVAFEASLGEVVDREHELFTIVDTSVVWVLADVYEKDLGLVTEGVEVEVRLPAYGDEVFAGTLEYVADFLDPQSRTAKVRCVVDNADGRLKLEMYGTVTIPVVLTEGGISVPVNALQTLGDSTVVFVQESSERFVAREVEAGLRGDTRVQITRGLAVGERVATEGSFYLKAAVLRGSIGDDH